MEESMNEAIRRMTDAVQDILEGKMHSAWLYGSAALDDFRLGWSDIDVLILAREEITQSQARALVGLRQALTDGESGNPYYRAFEGVIAAADEYRAGAFTRLVYWGTTGQKITARYQPDAFARLELATVGRCVAGAADRSLFTAPSKEEIIAVVRGHYEAIRQFAVQTDGRLYSCGWLLDIARCVHTLRCGGVTAKTKAGQWALETGLFPDGAPLEKTLEIRQNPLRYKDREDVKAWLRGLGPTVQQYADVMEKELETAGGGA